MLKTMRTQLILTFDETNVKTRLLIILGSILLLWSILGLIYLCTQLYHYWNENKNDYFSSWNTWSKRSKGEPLLDVDSDDGDDDERMSILTSISWVSHRTKVHLPSMDSSSITATSSTTTAPSILTKSSPLPTLMVTDCDRLQTDIIELEHFEPLPRPSLHRSSSGTIDLRLLLNDRMP